MSKEKEKLKKSQFSVSFFLRMSLRAEREPLFLPKSSEFLIEFPCKYFDYLFYSMPERPEDMP